MKKLTLLGVIAGAALLSATPFSLQTSQKSIVLSLDSAEAREGTPVTAASVAVGSGRVRRRRVARVNHDYGGRGPGRRWVPSPARKSSDGDRPPPSSKTPGMLGGFANNPIMSAATPAASNRDL